MRDAITELNGIEQSDVVIDNDEKTATVTLAKGDPSVDAIVAHIAGTRYRVRPRS